MSLRPGPAQGFKGFHPVLNQGQAGSEVLRVMGEKQLLTGQKNDLAFCFLSFCFKTGSHVVQADPELLSSCLNLPRGGFIGVLHHAQS